MESDPITYPCVRIDGADVPLKFRQWDILELAKAGINLFERQEPKPLTSVEGMTYNLTLLKHAVAHKLPDITVEELSKNFEIGELLVLDDVISAALKKVWSQIMPGLERRQQQAAALKAATSQQATTEVQ